MKNDLSDDVRLLPRDPKVTISCDTPYTPLYTMKSIVFSEDFFTLFGDGGVQRDTFLRHHSS